MTKFVSLALLAAGGFLSAEAPHSASKAPLKAIFIDVEGGQSTLFVTPGGESLLIDTGWPGNEGRDADRIVKAAHQLGVQRLDYVLLTHYHVDHAGGVPQLAARMPIGTFLDHGPNRELDHGITEKDYADYQQVLSTGKSKHLTLRPGDHLPVPGLDALVISSDGDLIAKPLSGAGSENPYCAESEIRPADQTENARSLGIEITFGKLRILDLGDLTWDKERELMCPVNELGKVDVLVVSHHGWVQSSSPALVHAIAPRVAIMDNGAKKGGTPATIKSIEESPGLKALYQLHFSEEAGLQGNVGAPFVANPQGPDAAFGIELDAYPDGHFSVTNQRTGQRKSY